MASGGHVSPTRPILVRSWGDLEVVMAETEMAYELTTTPSVDHDDRGGWTVQRLRVLSDAFGICTRCGMTGADTAIRGWVDERLVAAHTRCVVGLGPPRPDRADRL